MNVSDAIEIMKQNFDILWKSRTPIMGRASEALPLVNGCSVEVYRVPAHLLPIHEGYRANATVMANLGRYIIFLSDSPTPAPARLGSLREAWLERYYVLHEYGHIKQGDVFEDDPAKIFSRFVTPFFDWQAVEHAADAWAAHLLMEEARVAGNTELERELSSEIVQRGLPRPLSAPVPSGHAKARTDDSRGES